MLAVPREHGADRAEPLAAARLVEDEPSPFAESLVRLRGADGPAERRPVLCRAPPGDVDRLHRCVERGDAFAGADRVDHHGHQCFHDSPAPCQRAGRIVGAAAKPEVRQPRSAAAAMCLAPLPVAVVVAGVWMAVTGLFMGAQWATDVDGSVWLGVGRWLVVAVSLAGTGCARPIPCSSGHFSGHLDVRNADAQVRNLTSPGQTSG